MEKIYRNRISMFDFAKGVAMLCICSAVALGYYAGFDESILGLGWRIISFPGTAALLLIMGYWYKPKPVASWLKQLWHNDIRAYIVTALITIAAAALLFWSNSRTFREELRYVLISARQFLLAKPYGIGALWYIVAYIVGISVLNLLLNSTFFENHKIFLYLIMLLMAAGALFICLYDLPFCLGESMAAVSTFYVGYCLRKNGFLIRKWRFWEYLMLLGLLAINCGIYYGMELLMGSYSMYNHTGMVLFIPGGILLLRFSLFVQNTEWKGIDWILEIGSNSVLIMMILTVDMEAMNWERIINASFMPENDILNAIAVLLMKAIIYIFLVWAIRHKSNIAKFIKTQCRKIKPTCRTLAAKTVLLSKRVWAGMVAFYKRIAVSCTALFRMIRKTVKEKTEMTEKDENNPT